MRELPVDRIASLTAGAAESGNRSATAWRSLRAFHKACTRGCPSALWVGSCEAGLAHGFSPPLGQTLIVVCQSGAAECGQAGIEIDKEVSGECDKAGQHD